MNLTKNIGTPFEFDKNVNLKLTSVFLAKEWHKLTTIWVFSDPEGLKTIF